MSKAMVVLIAFTGVAFAYPVLMRLLAGRLQPMRVRMLKLGDKLLNSPSTTAAQKDLVQSMIDDAFSSKFMFSASLILPVYTLARAVFRFQAPSPFRDIPQSVATQLDQFQGYHLRATAAANPICAIILALELLFLWLPLRALGLLPSETERHNNIRKDVRLLASEIEFRRSHAYNAI